MEIQKFLDSEGLQELVLAIKTLDSEGDGIEIERSGLNHIFSVKYDDKTVVLDSEGLLSVPLDERTVIVGPEGLVEVPIDGVSIRINSEGLLESDYLPRPIVDDTFLHVDSEGTTEWVQSKINGVSLVGDNNTEDVKIVKWLETSEEYEMLESEGLIEDYTFYIINNGEKTVNLTDYDDLSNRPSINNMILSGNKTSADLNMYTIPQVDNLLASQRSLKVVEVMPAAPQINTLYYVGTINPYDVYLVDRDGTVHFLGSSDVNAYTTDASLRIINNEISHSNNIVAAPEGKGGTEKLLTIKYDSQGHITDVIEVTPFDVDDANAISDTNVEVMTQRAIYHGLPQINNDHTYDSDSTIYAPVIEGEDGQYLKSIGGDVPVWTTPDDSIDVDSTEKEIPSSKAVYDYCTILQSNPTWTDSKASLNLSRYTRVGKVIEFYIEVSIATECSGLENNLGFIKFGSLTCMNSALNIAQLGTGTCYNVNARYDGGNIYLNTTDTIPAGTKFIISGTLQIN